MNRKDVLVIRIGLSIESVDNDNTTITVEPETPETEGTTQHPNSDTETRRISIQPPRRSFGRGDSPRDSELGEKRAMTDMQRKALFRIAYDLGDKESALSRILEALGVRTIGMGNKRASIESNRATRGAARADHHDVRMGRVMTDIPPNTSASSTRDLCHVRAPVLLSLCPARRARVSFIEPRARLGCAIRRSVGGSRKNSRATNRPLKSPRKSSQRTSRRKPCKCLFDGRTKRLTS